MHRANRMETLPKQFFANLVGQVQARVKDGHDVINLGQGNPDLPTPPHIVEALRAAALDATTHRYPPFSGLPSLKEAVAEFYAREYGVTLHPDREIAILFGGKTGLVELSEIYLNPGDAALVPDPGYPDYWSGIALAGGQIETMPLLAGNQFLPDFTRISSDVWNRAKLMFLNYPNNPTGAVAKASVFEDAVYYAEQHDVLVVHDFAYGAFGFDGQKPMSFLQVQGAKEVGVEIYTMSKTFNMAGWRIAFAVGNSEVVKNINLLQDHYYVSLFPAIQRAAIAALSGPQDCVRDLAGIYESRRNAFMSIFTREELHFTPPSGSFFCWLPVPKVHTSTSLTDLLLRTANVAVAPGIGFGTAGDDYVRVGLLTDEDRLCTAAERMAQVFVRAREEELRTV